MKTITSLFALLIGLTLVSCAHQKAATTTPALKAESQKTIKRESAGVLSDIKCKRGDDVRSITNMKWEEGLCQVQYSKFGNGKFVAWAKHQAKYCGNVSENIKGNLAAAGYKCE